MEVGWLSKGESRQDGRVVGVCLVSGEAEAVRGAALEVVMRQRLEVGGARPHWPPPPPTLSFPRLRSVFLGGAAQGSFGGGYKWEGRDGIG